MQTIVFFIYNYIAFPILYLLIYIISFFNKRINRSLKLRGKSIVAAQSTIFKYDQKILIHCASLGEFEHIKPLIGKLNKTNKASIIVTFFSPSGYDNVKSFPGVELFLYLPLDRPKTMKRFYISLKPKMIVLSKHDAWPNQVRIANVMGIPILLINASLSEISKRIKGPGKRMLNYVYPLINIIYTISERDTELFRKHFPKCSIKQVGDTKFDQVLSRKEKAVNKNILPETWHENKSIIVFGSIWPEDMDKIKSTVQKIYAKNKDWKLILVPHDPDEKFINRIFMDIGEENGFLFSDLDKKKPQGIMVVDTIGVLADLYKYAKIAYVGGGFKQGIHNVMEPAVYGVPVLYGPFIENASEAVRLNENGGSYIAHTAAELEEYFMSLINDKNLRENVGERAAAFAKKNSGAANILIDEWKQYLKN